MLDCCEGHQTEIYVRMRSANGQIIFNGVPDELMLGEILEALDVGACPICIGGWCDKWAR